MNVALKQKSVVFILIAVVLTFVVPVAQAIVAKPLVRLTGTFYLPGEKGVEHGANTLTVCTLRSKWIFDVWRAQEPGKFDSQVLQNVFPPILQFMGPKDVIASLDKPEMAGKLITVEGYIYRTDNIFVVTAVRTGVEYDGFLEGGDS